jgi:hypothetical protein
MPNSLSGTPETPVTGHNEEGTAVTYPPPGQPAAGNDRSQLLGILGIVIGLLCCWPAGVVLGVISIIQANKFGSNKLWGILAIVASVVGALISFTVTIPQINNN